MLELLVIGPFPGHHFPAIGLYHLDRLPNLHLFFDDFPEKLGYKLLFCFRELAGLLEKPLQLCLGAALFGLRPFQAKDLFGGYPLRALPRDVQVSVGFVASSFPRKKRFFAVFPIL